MQLDDQMVMEKCNEEVKIARNSAIRMEMRMKISGAFTFIILHSK